MELLGRSVALDPNMGIFITMNPGYAGRSNLPDNLKNLFRSVAMTVPDRKLIAQVMLYSQGIVTAEQLAPKIVDLFLLCDAKMSKQRHYDFGLRALKTLLVSAGAMKRKALEGKGDLEGKALADEEEKALIVGTCNNVLPKLIAEDMIIFKEVLESVFPGSEVSKMDDEHLKEEMLIICENKGLVTSDGFIQKMLQLKQVIEMRHGIMVVGPCGSGKSAALRVLLESMEKVDGIKGDLYVIDPKSIHKENLYGSLDGTTLEWTDGVFTGLLRRITDNQKGESERRHWVVFDGNVDPDWAENLNRYAWSTGPPAIRTDILILIFFCPLTSAVYSMTTRCSRCQAANVYESPTTLESSLRSTVSHSQRLLPCLGAVWCGLAKTPLQPRWLLVT